MFRKLIMSLAPVLAVVAFAIVPAVAQAAHWDHCIENKIGKFKDHTCSGTTVANGGWELTRIPNGRANQEKVKTHGTLALSIAVLKDEIKCEVKDQGFIWNVLGVGKDSITDFINSNCKTEKGECLKPEINALQVSLPWPSRLIQGPPIRDVIENIEIEVRCSGAAVDIFQGTLEPTISEKNGTATFGTGSGALKDEAGNEATVTGEDAVEQENGWAVAAQQ
jgi:hypothetical protein